MTITTNSPAPSIDEALAAGLRWLYATVQPDDALVERAGARISTGDRLLRFLPISATGTPLIVVDLLDVHWSIAHGRAHRRPPRWTSLADIGPGLSLAW